MSGILYLVATPIGNLQDITLRALSILKEVDLIAAEDTRQSRKLLNHYDIHKPLISYHEHNKYKIGPVLLEKLLQGQTIALISDAGTPGISDPGEDLVKEALAKDIQVQALPGASALLTALVISGLSCRRFAFEGFLPREKTPRRQFLETLAKEERTMVFYEAPHRLLAVLSDLKEAFGNRPLVAARELTKHYEEVLRFDLDSSLEYFAANPPRGEFTLLVQGAEVLDEELPSDEVLISLMDKLLAKGLSRKAAAKELASRYQDVSVKYLYDISLK